MGTKELLESFKHSLEQENRQLVESDDYLDNAITIAANVKRIFYAEIAIKKIDEEVEGLDVTSTNKAVFNQEILDMCIEKARVNLSKISDLDDHVLVIKNGE